jgi:hypothetical protein
MQTVAYLEACQGLMAKVPICCQEDALQKVWTPFYGYETSLPKLKNYYSTFTMLLKRDETKRNEKIKLDRFSYYVGSQRPLFAMARPFKKLANTGN